MYAVLLVGLLLLCVLVYSVNFAHNQEEEQAATPKVDIKEEERPLLMGEGRGLAAPPTGSPALATPEPKATGSAKREPLIVVQQQREQPDQYRQELENLRRMKAQAQITALSAPLGVKKASDSSGQSGQQTVIAHGDPRRESAVNLGGDLSSLRENGYDPAADQGQGSLFRAV